MFLDKKWSKEFDSVNKRVYVCNLKGDKIIRGVIYTSQNGLIPFGIINIEFKNPYNPNNLIDTIKCGCFRMCTGYIHEKKDIFRAILKKYQWETGKTFIDSYGEYDLRSLLEIFTQNYYICPMKVSPFKFFRPDQYITGKKLPRGYTRSQQDPPPQKKISVIKPFETGVDKDVLMHEKNISLEKRKDNDDDYDEYEAEYDTMNEPDTSEDEYIDEEDDDDDDDDF